MKPEESILADALERPALERRTFVDRACGGNGVLRDRVLALLRGYEGAGAGLEASPVAGVAKSARVGEAGEARDYAPGMRLGRYKLLERLGEGGCGVVFMAEQEEPVYRRVALKVVKLGMDTREVIARFEAERQALALMDHPNIAHVLDAGATENGRPFFVMELVRGVPITHHCDQYRLSSVGRVQLFILVCSAIQHAHQKGIIHRDIKPSNILVTLHDGVPVPKIIDFGIAKAMHGPLTDRTLFTAFEQFVGTPAYMSPEQMEMSGIDIDTRSDLYSLGVLLYELLTGRTPFDTRDLLKSGLEGMRRTVREMEPAKPSTRVSTLNVADGSAIAARRGTDPARLHSWLRGDVDWIVMRCLEKDRMRRYETASGLALDLQRYLRNEPITARPPSTAYSLRKFVRRNQLAIGAATAVVIALVAGLAFSALALTRERLARQRADLEAARSAQLAHLMQDMLAGVGPQVAVGRDTRLLRTILDETVVRLNTQLRGQPEVEANFRETLGHVYRDLGEWAAAALMYERALQLRRAALGSGHPAVAAALHELGETLGRLGRLPEAERHLREALALREQRLGGDHPETAASRRAFAHVHTLARATNGEPGGQAATAGPRAGRQPAVIRMALAGGTVGGKPIMPNVLSIAHQRRVLEEEFEGEGVRIEWSSPSYYTARDTLVQGGPDFSNVGPVHALVARAKGLDYKLVLPINGLHAPVALVVRSVAPFRTLADLRGQRLGLCRGTRSHLILCRMIERHGFQESDFSFVGFPGNAAIDTAFALGEVDARLAEAGERGDAGQRQGTRAVATALHEADLDSGGKLAVSVEFEREYPAVVQRVVSALVKAAAWSSDEGNRARVLELWASSPEQLASLTAASASVGLKERLSPLMGDAFIAGLRRDCADAKRFGLVAAEADLGFDGWVEPKYLRQALRELRLEGYWPEPPPEGGAAEVVGTPVARTPSG